MQRAARVLEKIGHPCTGASSSGPGQNALSGRFARFARFARFSAAGETRRCRAEIVSLPRLCGYRRVSLRLALSTRPRKKKTHLLETRKERRIACGRQQEKRLSCSVDCRYAFVTRAHRPAPPPPAGALLASQAPTRPGASRLIKPDFNDDFPSRAALRISSRPYAFLTSNVACLCLRRPAPRPLECNSPFLSS